MVINKRRKLQLYNSNITLEGAYDMSLIERLYKSRCVRGRIFYNTSDDAEVAHEWGLERLEAMQRSWLQKALARQLLVYNHPMLNTNMCGINFPNPLGLSAGFDKFCQVYWGAIPACGWGFCEIGSITRHRQTGNQRPRMLRSQEHQALWNWMGFNNPGAEAANQTMAANPTSPIPIGLSVGKSKVAELDEAPQDYLFTINKLWRFTDFIVINLSSPNTPGLRELQQKDRLQQLIAVCKQANTESAQAWGKKIQPLGLKISPDESEEQLADIIDVCKKENVDFIVATNATTSRNGCLGWNIDQDKGGVSGSPLRERSLKVQTEICKSLKGEKIAVIGSGGIKDGRTMFERITQGASLCQALTAWPFEGPDFVKRTLQELVEILKVEGFDHVSKAVGVAL